MLWYVDEADGHEQYRRDARGRRHRRESNTTTTALARTAGTVRCGGGKR